MNHQGKRGSSSRPDPINVLDMDLTVYINHGVQVHRTPIFMTRHRGFRGSSSRPPMPWRPPMPSRPVPPVVEACEQWWRRDLNGSYSVPILDFVGWPDEGSLRCTSWKMNMAITSAKDAKSKWLGQHGTDLMVCGLTKFNLNIYPYLFCCKAAAAKQQT